MTRVFSLFLLSCKLFRGILPSMYGDTDNLPEVKKRLDTVSPTFCMAKWLHATIHLMNGTTHSCYLPPVHPIPLNEVTSNPGALHNTSEKKQQRKMMKEGKRPKGCHMCWAIEDLPGGERISDRILRGSESWTTPYFNKLKEIKWNEDVYPTYLEVSFNPVCNFKCSYCSPHVSTAWHQEIRKNGPYALSKHIHQDIRSLRTMGWMPIEDEDMNPYVDAFWKWWPEAYKHLHVFRITGGEPLLSKNTFKTLDWVEEHPNEKLELEVNTNMGIPKKITEKFIVQAERIMQDKKIRRFGVHTSCDNYGPRAEYIRNGMNFQLFRENVDEYLSRIPNGELSFMCTFNALSVDGFKDFLDYILELRAKHSRPDRFINLDIPHLTGPEHLSVRILTKDYETRIEDLISYMKSKVGSDRATSTFRPMEVEKLTRILEWMRAHTNEDEKNHWRRDFYLYFSEHDRRRNTDFLKTFPGMEEFWHHCAGLT